MNLVARGDQQPVGDAWVPDDARALDADRRMQLAEIAGSLPPGTWVRPPWRGDHETRLASMIILLVGALAAAFLAVAG